MKAEGDVPPQIQTECHIPERHPDSESFPIAKECSVPIRGECLFTWLTGLWLGLALLKFGNPVIFDDQVARPVSLFQWLIQPWPLAWGLFLFVPVALAGLRVWRRVPSPPVWVIVLPLAWLGWQMLSALCSVDPRLSGITVIHFAVCVACFYWGAFALGHVANMRPVWLGWTVGYVIVLAVGLQQHFGGLEETRRWFFAYQLPKLPQPPSPEFMQKLASNRIYATLFYPNTFAGAILLLLPIVGGFLWRMRRLTQPARALQIGLIGVGSLGCLYWSASKAGWLILLILAVVAFLNAPVGKAIRVAALSLLLLGGLAGFYARYHGYFARGATSATARFDYWRAALQTVGKQPVLGSGPGTFGAVYREIKSPEAEMARLAHNDYLQQASDSGIPGGVSYLVLMGGSLVLLARSCASSPTRFPVWLGLLGLALQAVVEFGLFIPALAWPQFLLLGWLWGDASMARTGTDASPKSAHWSRGPAALGTLLLTAQTMAGATSPNAAEFKGNGICQFAIHGFQFSPQAEVSVNQAVQKLLDQHQTVFGFVRRPDFRLRMRVFGRWEDFTNAPAMRGRTNLAGIYVPSDREIITWRQEVPGALGTTLLHEASHAIMHAYYRRLPVWFSEGAADYFAFASQGRNPRVDRSVCERWALLNLWLREDRLPALPTLLNANDPQWQQLEIGQAYMASWSLVQFLLGSETNRYVMKQMLSEWQEPGRRRLDTVAQVERLYPGGLTAFTTSWHRWIDRTGTSRSYRVSWRNAGQCQFALHGFSLTAPVESAVNQQVEALLERHKAIFGTNRGSNQSLRIRIFGSFQDYVRFTTNWMISGWEATAERLNGTDGYNNPLFGEIVTWNPQTPDQLTRRVVCLAHDALLHEAFPAAPRWFRIGSLHAMAMNRDRVSEGAALAAAWKRAGLDLARMPSWRAILNDSVPQAALTMIGSLNPHEVACWALFQFLASSEVNRKILLALLEFQLPPAGAAANGANRLERLYPGGGSRFEADFKRWLSQQGLGL